MIRVFAFSLLLVAGLASSSSAQQNFDLPSSMGSPPAEQAAYNAWFTGPGAYEPTNPYLQPYEPSTVYSPRSWQEEAEKAGEAGAAAGGEAAGGEAAGGGGGSLAAQATNSSAPLSQIQFQNVFIPESYDSTGYSNQFVLQPVIAVMNKPDTFLGELFPYHILRPTIPILAPSPDPDGPIADQGGLGDTTYFDLWIHPIKGFGEHVDHHVGRLLAELDELGVRDNTLVFYIWGDNGSSSEGGHGTLSELLVQNQIPVTIDDQLKTLEAMGGLDVLGTPKVENMFHAGWAWAGATPYKGTKLLGAYFGGTRQPMVVSWPKVIKHDTKMRRQFHHVSDVAATIYEVLDITPPDVVHGYPQDPIDGVSMAYTFANAAAPPQKKTQFFDIMGSRGIYHEGWFACTFGPRVPWITITPGMATWTPDRDVWELYNLEEDWSQANDLAKKNPKKLEDMKALFIVESAKNYNMPMGGGLWVLLHPEDSLRNPATEFNYKPGLVTVPEGAVADFKRVHNLITLDVDMPKDANGVLFALGAISGGMTCYMKDGYLNYEYNAFEVQRTKIKSQAKLAAGKTKIEILLVPGTGKLVVPGDVSIKVNGQAIGKATVPNLANLLFSTEGFEVGRDEHSPVSLDYFDQGEFEFNGTIHNMHVQYLK